MTPNEQVHQSFCGLRVSVLQSDLGKFWAEGKVLWHSELHHRACDQSVRVDLTRVRSGSLSSDVQPHKVFVARRTAQPRFAKVDRAGQEKSVTARARAASCWDVNVAPPSPSPPGCEQVALLPEKATESHGDARVSDATRNCTLKCSNAGWRERNRRRCDLVLAYRSFLSKRKWICWKDSQTHANLGKCDSVSLLPIHCYMWTELPVLKQGHS